ncbi:MAG: efflux transporter outer membrane subunit [Polyangiaceae bacterium]|nr:efflux transporter outer membrane subunit [Polyangiaceae bacterium]
MPNELVAGGRPGTSLDAAVLDAVERIVRLHRGAREPAGDRSRAAARPAAVLVVIAARCAAALHSTNAQLLTRSLVLLAGLGLAGCAVGPDYRRPAPSAPARWSRVDATVKAVAHAGAPGDLSEWWRGLNDPLLSELVEQALRTSLDLRSARARLRGARARRAVAGSERFPGVTASASASRRESSRDAGGGAASDVLSAAFDASWELDVFGGVRRSVEAAEADLQSSAASLNDTRVSLVAEVARNYVEVRALQIRLGIARDNLASQSETLELTGWRAQAGLVTSQDVEQARSNREQTLAQIPSLEISLAEAEHRLDILLGKAPGTLHVRLAAGGGLPAVPFQVAVGIPAAALRRRPDVRAAERKLAAETARVGVAQAALYPSFELSGSIGIEALLQGALGGGGGAFSSLLAGITAPIFNAGRLRGQVQIQDAVREQARVAYEQTVLAALQEVEDALVALARSRERGEALARAALAARNAAVLARLRYGAGVIDFQSVLDTERTVLSLEDSLASARADEVLALIRLYKALGGGWSPEAEPRPAGEDAR